MFFLPEKQELKSLAQKETLLCESARKIMCNLGFGSFSSSVSLHGCVWFVCVCVFYTQSHRDTSTIYTPMRHFADLSQLQSKLSQHRTRVSVVAASRRLHNNRKCVFAYLKTK